MTMVSIYRYETATLPLKFKPTGVLNDYKHIIVSIAQNGIQVDKDENDLTIDTTNDTITLSLTQEDTGKFKSQRAEIQVNIYYNNEERDVSTRGAVVFLDNLYKKVIDDE